MTRLIGLWGLLFAIGFASPAEAQLVKPLQVVDYELRTDTPAPDVAVPLQLEEGAELDGVALLAVTLDGKPQPALLAAFSKAIESSRPASPNPQLQLTADDRVRTPGTYDVSLSLEGTLNGAAKTQPLQLKLVMPRPQLRSIPALVIVDERFWPTDWWTGSIKTKLTLYETGRLTGLTGLSISQLDPATLEQAQIDASFGPALGALTAGGNKPFDLFGEKFPLGTTRGHLTVAADQLAPPIVVPFEVRSRIVDLWIVPLFWIAGVIGWLVRHKLKSAEERAVLDAKLAPLRQRVKKLQADSPKGMDSALGALTTADAKVDDALKGGDNQALAAAVTALQTALQTALDTRDRLMAERLAAASALRDTLATEWKVPEKQAPLLTGALQHVQASISALLANEAKLAETERIEAEKALDQVGAGIAAWALEADRVLEQLMGKLPASARKDGDPLVASARQAIAPISKYDATQRPVFEPYFRWVNAAWFELDRLAAEVRPAFVDDARGAIAALTKAGRADDAKVEAIAALEAPSTDPVGELTLLAAAISKFVEALDGMLESAEAKAALEAGKYAEAVRSEPGIAIEEAVPVGAGPAAASGKPGAERRRVSKREPTVAASAAQHSLPRARPVDPVELAAARLQTIQITRGIVSAVVLSIVGWAAYRTSWVGTVNDFLGVAVVAFFTDFTLDAVIQAVQRVGKPATS